MADSAAARAPSEPLAAWDGALPGGALPGGALPGGVLPGGVLPGELGSLARTRARVAELLVCGGGTLLLLPLCWWLRAGLGLDDGELLVGALTFHAASLINDPHFSVTYLLFYRDARSRALGPAYRGVQRARYWLAGALVPLGLVAWAGWAIARDSPAALGAMIQLMFVLVGWHYVKQGFGMLGVLSARRGVRWARSERRVILAHCFAAWAYAWASPFDPGTRSVVQGVLYTTWPHPPGLLLITRIAFFSSALVLVAMVARKWRREGRPPALGPLACFAISLWIWTVYTRLDPLLAYFIPAFHSLQYLYFVGLLSGGRARAAAGPPSFRGSVGRQLAVLGLGAVALGWFLLRGAPAWLDSLLVLPASSDPRAMAAIGPSPYLAAFTTVVNVHHYFMDSVIWRREEADTRYLLPAAGERAEAAEQGVFVGGESR